MLKKNDIVITSAPHESYHLAIAMCKLFKKVKWIADFRDLWLQDKTRRVYPSKLHKKINILMLKFVYRSADKIVFNNEPYKLWADKNYPEYRHKYECIPVFNELIKLNSDLNFPKDKEQNIFNIVFAGYLDKGERVPFKHILDIFIKANAAGCNFKVNLIGRQSNRLMNHISSKGYNDYIEILPPMTLKEVYKTCSMSDGLLVALENKSYTEMIVPKKLYDYLNVIYMGFKVPILGLVPANGACAQIIETTGSGFVNPLNDDAVDFLCDIYSTWKNKKLEIKPNHHIEDYMASSQIPKWLNLVDQLAS
jgi:hypothetical protein